MILTQVFWKMFS